MALPQGLGVAIFLLIAIAELRLALKFHPHYFNFTWDYLIILSVILSINYGLIAVYSLVVYPLFFSPLRRLRGPKSITLLLYAALKRTDRASTDLVAELGERYPNEDIISLGLSKSTLLVVNPRLLGDILVRRPYEFVKMPSLNSFLRLLLGDGLVTLDGDMHKFLRKSTLPAFNFRHIKGLYPMMWTKAVTLATILKSETSGSDPPPAEISARANSVTLDIIGVAGLGHEFDTLGKSDDPLLKIYREILEQTPEKQAYALACMMFDHRLVRALPWKMNKRARELTNQLSGIGHSLVQRKRDAIEKNDVEHSDVLSLMIKSNHFSDEDLTGQLVTFLSAGHETTASALTWVCYLLAEHQDVQETLREEVREALPIGMPVDPKVDIAALLEGLPYLNGIMHETLRLYPTVPWSFRQAIGDTMVAEYPVRKGTNIILSMWLINRSPELWGSDAGMFRPERWITDGKPNQNGGAESNYNFLTFLHGPRSCIGQNFAKAEMRCLLAALAGSFSWDLSPGQDIIPSGVITIKPANGLYLRLKPLDA